MLSRRHFLTNTAMLGSAAGFAATPLSSAVAAAVDDLETTTWSCCSINCGSRCLLRCVSKKGRVIRIETDDTGDASARPAPPRRRLPAGACLPEGAFDSPAPLCARAPQVPDEARRPPRRRAASSASPGSRPSTKSPPASRRPSTDHTNESDHDHARLGQLRRSVNSSAAAPTASST